MVKGNGKSGVEWVRRLGEREKNSLHCILHSNMLQENKKVGSLDNHSPSHVINYHSELTMIYYNSKMTFKTREFVTFVTASTYCIYTYKILSILIL